uniref:CHCH domain-containing protein n=2 Tax=Physcomitrium patens TaxID=3218 RepID=A0A7I4CAZ5_PHYPA|nr:cytochrome c oxidase-assembly factor COX23, mitochondrial-like [Physcomitrium patens]|eukprot:XP_024360385.1 cytochrome c oxidase-assembly factor COX23, mitochondrial-like [Physcomitrella patens]
MASRDAQESKRDDPPQPSTSSSTAMGETDAPARTGPLKLSDSMCAPQYAASLKCLDEANYDKSKCQDHFDAYKECKKQERELRLEANRKSKSFF